MQKNQNYSSADCFEIKGCTLYTFVEVRILPPLKVKDVSTTVLLYFYCAATTLVLKSLAFFLPRLHLYILLRAENWHVGSE